MKKKKAKRKSATKKALAKTPKKKTLPDLVAGKFCIALGNSIYYGGKFTEAPACKGLIELHGDLSKATVAKELARLQAEAAQSGIDDGIASAKVEPMGKHFMTHWEFAVEYGLTTCLVLKDQGVTFREMVKGARAGFKHAEKNMVAEFKDAQRQYAGNIKGLKKDLGSFEKSVRKYV